MAVQAPPKTGFEKWQDGIDKAVGNTRWDSWDCEIRMAVDEYNRHLSGTAGYRPLDWQLIKAMVWVETGAESRKWGSNPMQIGNPGDPGLRSLLAGNEGGDLIIPAAWKDRLTAGAATTMGAYNIRAGIGYLLMRMANYAIKSVPDSDSATYEVNVQAGDSISKIAKAKGSTVEIMQKLNPAAHILRPGQTLKYRKASLRKVIVGWKIITTSSIATSYNVGDSMYAKKLDYALALIRNGEAAICAY
ncbi:LysM peptidoglycan-binding domain-containing protein [Burkholderia dolosa]|uniref:LysM peptidoglycan-binding domain-containing protein n=1 Tax=Burkholderia dolosa TaxID=152500 RepID=A0A892I329_9BURK|nr:MULTISPECIES: LysM domain-containing protein [Burkholderia]AKE04546.1 peptidoglycan-binding protein [Burkholderia cepacia]AJY12389.1 lysM domain protein [Burkholderia dolosa AU0158]AYZ96489.1 LysM domain-containing protein [Burkholderia dolosa]ETP66360.1 peptidoglycan-binding protein [Burkholderia dolosa PC543]MBR8417427.1 LysM peptidoglycan-binding domain-containing protein [Burkholderia dolosa]